MIGEEVRPRDAGEEGAPAVAVRDYTGDVGVGERTHEEVAGHYLAVGQIRAGDSAVVEGEGPHRLAQPHRPAPALDEAPRRLAGEGGEPDARHSEGGVGGAAEQTHLHHHQAHVRADVTNVVVQRGEDDQVPEVGDRPLALAVSLQPVVEGLPVELFGPLPSGRSASP